MTKFFSSLVEAEKHSIGIFENSEGLIAYIWIETLDRPQSPFTNASGRLHVHHISVVPDWRGRGVGSALVDWADNCARAAEISEVTVDHWAANKDAHGFFVSEGFEDVRIVMRRMVDDEKR